MFGLALLLGAAPMASFIGNGLALWLDAADLSTITQDGSALVSQWNDKSLNGNHVTQGTSLNQPKYIASAINSRPAIQSRHDGVNASLLSKATNSTLTYTTFESFAVAQRVSDLGANETICGKWTVTANQREHRLLVESSDKAAAQGTTNGTTTSTGTVTGAIATGTPFIINGFYDGSNLNVQRNNGTAVTASQASQFNGTGVYGLFAHDLVVDPFAGYVGEHLFFTRLLTATERATVLRYLSAKWAIAIS